MSIKVTGLRETIEYLGGLKKGIPAAAKEAVAGQQAREEFRGLAVRIVDNVVYAVYEPAFYERTFKLLESIGAFMTVEKEKITEIGIGLDVATAPAISGSAAGNVNYGIFMLPELYQKSFIGHGTLAHLFALPRDFAAAWMQAFGELAPARVVEALEREMSK